MVLKVLKGLIMPLNLLDLRGISLETSLYDLYWQNLTFRQEAEEYK